MPTKRTWQTHTGLSDAMVEYLLTGDWPRDAAGERVPGYLQAFLLRGEGTRARWREHRDVLMAEWARRGSVGKPWGARLCANPRMSVYARRRKS